MINRNIHAFINWNILPFYHFLLGSVTPSYYSYPDPHFWGVSILKFPITYKPNSDDFSSSSYLYPVRQAPWKPTLPKRKRNTNLTQGPQSRYLMIKRSNNCRNQILKFDKSKRFVSACGLIRLLWFDYCNCIHTRNKRFITRPGGR